jgi:uncharacterized membrane protein YoaK (UPF0700 family)
MQTVTSLDRGEPTTRKDLIRASLMTAIGGFVDAVGYAATGHLYLSFMSGNSTQFGMALARGDTHVIGWTGAVIAAFVLGAFLGSLIAAFETQPKLPLVLMGEFLCFVAAWMLLDRWTVEAALLLVALAMGMQNVIHTPVAGASIGRSFVTGTLFGVGNALARACLRRASLKEAAADAASWLAFIAGVTGGALVLGAVGIATALLAAASAVAALTILSLLWRR